MAGADVTGTVNASIDDVWKLFRPFGQEIMTWWPIYNSVEIVAPGTDDIGCERVIDAKDGNTYHEVLDQRDDDKHVLQYTLKAVSPSVPTLKNVVTRVEMTAQDQGKTLIHWTSEVDASGLVAGKVASVQQGIYQAAIGSLDRAFNPAIGELEVEIINAKGLHKKGLFAPNPYVVVDLDEAGPRSSRVRHHSTGPKWNEKVVLPVVSLAGRLRISVWDENVLSSDDFLGAIDFDLHSLPDNQIHFQKFKLTEVDTGELSLSFELKLKDGDKLGQTQKALEIQDLEQMKHVMNELKDQALHTLQEVSGEDPDEYGYARYPRSPLYPDVDLENLPKMVDQLHMSQVLPPEKLGRVMKRISEYAYSQVNFLKRNEKTGDLYTSVYGEWIDKSEYVVDHWDDDQELCRQLMQGVNPTTLALCTAETSIPDGLGALSAEGKSVDELIAEKRLFILDYNKIDGIPQYRDMCVYAPIALVYRETETENTGGLNILGFQLSRDDNAEIFTPGGAMPLRYRFAKMHWMNADNQYHQFIEHLGNAHLAMEPLAVAHHNSFPAGHPVGDAMRPHFRETIGINYLARQTLVSPIIPFTDRTFSLGTAGSLWLFRKSYAEWDFKACAFPRRLAARGFDEQQTDGLATYYYRDDGFLIWNALLDYFGDIVNAQYNDDASVMADPAIAKWCAESTDPERANLKGFPEQFNSRQELAEAITTVVFNCSAQHSAVNFSQYPFVSYIPNRPDSMFAWMPDTREELTEDFISSALPDVNITQFQAMFAWLLTTPSLYPISELEGSKEHFPDIHKKHKAKFAEISRQIQARNEQLSNAGKMPYPFLDPAQVASSIDI